MSKSVSKQTVLAMTDMKESTELLAFKRQKNGYNVTVKISLFICVVLSLEIYLLATLKYTWCAYK